MAKKRPTKQPTHGVVRRSEAREQFERETGTKAPGKPAKLEKGSPEAKAHMAKLRQMRGKKR